MDNKETTHNNSDSILGQIIDFEQFIENNKNTLIKQKENIRELKQSITNASIKLDKLEKLIKLTIPSYNKMTK